MQRITMTLIIACIIILALTGNVSANHQGFDCSVCHDSQPTRNLSEILETIATPNSGPKEVWFTAYEDWQSFADGDTTYDGVCEVCHTLTLFHCNDGDGVDHFDGKDCRICHPHENDFLPTATGCDSSHGIHLDSCEQERDWTVGITECTECHNETAFNGGNYQLFGSDPGQSLDDTNVCDSCHGDNIPYGELLDTSCTPTISTSGVGLYPNAGCPSSLFEIHGACFGEEWLDGRSYVQMSPDGGTTWTDMYVQSWTDTKIVVRVPESIDDVGNYKVRVALDFNLNGTIEPTESSNKPKFIIIDCSTPYIVTGDRGPCLTQIKLRNDDATWPTTQTNFPDGGDDGLFRVIDFVSSQGHFTSSTVLDWGSDTGAPTGNDTMKVKFKNFYEDEQGDQENRNYYQDGDEPNINFCDGLGLGVWEIYLRYVTFYDADSSGTFNPNIDTILNVDSSKPGVVFTLTNDPYIRIIRPNLCEPLSKVKIKGENFGPTQQNSYVKVGDYIYTPGCPKVKSWSNTMIEFKVKDKPCSKFDPSVAGQFFLKYQVSVWVDQGDGDFVISNKLPLKVIKPISCVGTPYPGP